MKKKLAAFSLAVLAGFAVGRMMYQADLTRCREELKACRQALTQREDEAVPFTELTFYVGGGSKSPLDLTWEPGVALR